ncbi:MAG: DUF58 domain-containing protein [Planctomycetes bacterium]|nr:DUF58 domain-containing protein [Planctomycetota bacterium]
MSDAARRAEALFPPAFLRLLAAVPTVVRRARAGAAAGARAARGAGGAFLFRGHRPYRPGDDLRRLDWTVLARHDRVVVREFEAERDLRTEVWVDASASMGVAEARGAVARAAALAVATGLADGGRARLGVLAAGDATVRLDADDPAALPEVLRALEAERPAGRAHLAEALPRLLARVPARARLVLVTDLLTDADPAVLARLAGRGLSGALLHLRVPAVWAPPAEGLVEARDVETGAVRTVRWTPALAAEATARAGAHAERWARAAAAAGLACLPFAPSTPPETLLERLVREAT